MKLNRKGFTLVELLITIVIVGLVIGLSTFGIISLVNNSRSKKNILNEENIKEAAKIYSTEVGNKSWKSNDDYDVFCVTVGELMNKGFFDKNAVINDEITKDSFIIVKRNKVTLAIDSEEIVSDDINNNYNQICTGQTLSSENITKPVINSSTSYTDRIEISFNNGEAESGIKNYTCLYGESSSNINMVGTIENNKCILDGVKNNNFYYIFIYMNTNKGTSILADGEKEHNTLDFEEVTFNQSGNKITIEYSDKNIYEEGYHYFKSSVVGTTDESVSLCTLNNNRFNCDGNYNSIEENKWYRVEENKININYETENNNIELNTKTCDKSNNCINNKENIIIKKYTVRFYRNGVLNIEGDTSDYVERYCLTSNNGTCTIISPVIEAQTGYTGIGWNTDKNATNSSWDLGTSKSVDSDLEYYAISRISRVNILYSSNGGYIITTSNKGGIWEIDNDIVYNTINGETTSVLDVIEYGSAFEKNGLLNYNNSDYLNIGNSNYGGDNAVAVSGAEWTCMSENCTLETYNQKTNYKDSDFCDASTGDCFVVLGVNWSTSPIKMYVTAKNGLRCRVGPGTTYDKVKTYSCGTVIEGYHSKTNGWFYYPDSDCYLSDNYLSKTKKSCSEGTNGGTTSTKYCVDGGTGLCSKLFPSDILTTQSKINSMDCEANGHKYDYSNGVSRQAYRYICYE